VKPEDVDSCAMWDCKNIVGTQSLHFFTSISHREVTLLNLKELACFCFECMDDNPDFCENKSQVQPWKFHTLEPVNITGKEEFHSVNLVTFVFNVEVSHHVCSFYHGFGHLLASCLEIFSQIEIQPSLLVTFPPGNPPITTTSNYPNIVPRNCGSHSRIKGDRGEFIGFSNPTKNPFPSPKGYGFFAAPAPMMG
jgi:hypothetical protein